MNGWSSESFTDAAAPAPPAVDRCEPPLALLPPPEALVDDVPPAALPAPRGDGPLGRLFEACLPDEVAAFEAGAAGCCTGRFCLASDAQESVLAGMEGATGVGGGAGAVKADEVEELEASGTEAAAAAAAGGEATSAIVPGAVKGELAGLATKASRRRASGIGSRSTARAELRRASKKSDQGQVGNVGSDGGSARGAGGQRPDEATCRSSKPPAAS